MFLTTIDPFVREFERELKVRIPVLERAKPRKIAVGRRERKDVRRSRRSGSAVRCCRKGAEGGAGMTRLPLDDEHAPLYSLGQVADMLQVRQAFLRRLDSFAVVSPSRSAGGQRRYSRSDIDAVQYVVRLIGEGMTLSSIRRIMELEREVAGLREELERVRARLAELEGGGG